jgi:hypothetical protein
MTLLGACLGGLAGAGAIEVSELYGAIRSTKDFPWRHPGEVPLGPYLFSVILRLVLGAVAAALCATAGPLGTVGAVAAGIAAPKLREELGRHAPTAGAAPLAIAQATGGSVPQSLSPAPIREVPGEGGPVNAPR